MRCVVLGNGVVGAEKQALALARAVGLPFTCHHAAPAAGASLPTQAQLWLTSVLGERALGLPTLEPRPQLAISCGRASVPASVALRAASNGQTLTVHVQRPPCSASAFDLVVAPRHDFGDDPRSVPPNVLLTEGADPLLSENMIRDSEDAGVLVHILDGWEQGGGVVKRVDERALGAGGKQRGEELAYLPPVPHGRAVRRGNGARKETVLSLNARGMDHSLLTPLPTSPANSIESRYVPVAERGQIVPNLCFIVLF